MSNSKTIGIEIYDDTNEGTVAYFQWGKFNSCRLVKVESIEIIMIGGQPCVRAYQETEDDITTALCLEIQGELCAYISDKERFEIELKDLIDSSDLMKIDILAELEVLK